MNQFAPTEDEPDGRLIRPSVGIFDVCWFCPLELLSIVDGPVGGAINVGGEFIEGKLAGFKVVCRVGSSSIAGEDALLQDTVNSKLHEPNAAS